MQLFFKFILKIKKLNRNTLELLNICIYYVSSTIAHILIYAVILFIRCRFADTKFSLMRDMQ